jgi:arabinosaccharide transport system permease protein
MDTQLVYKTEKSRYGSMRSQGSLYTFLAMLFFTLLCALVVLPVLTFILAAFRPGRDLVRYGLNVKLDFGNMSLNNYRYLFTGEHSYFIWFKNSLVLTTVTVLLTILVCYFVAYGLAMYQFKLRNLFFMLILIRMMVPFEILMLPLYVEIISMGLINTMAGVILPGLCASSTIFFFRQFMIGLPKDLLDAGRIDGANEYRICFTIILPLTKPAFAAMGILSAMHSWNNVLWPLLVYRDASKFTLPIGLNTLITPYGNNYDLLIAGSCFSILPIFLLFLFFQKYFIGGMTLGSLKG